jgi:hypothetical protein
MSAVPDLPLGFSGYPNLPGFDKENRTLVYAMYDAGWTGRRTSKGHFLMKAPDGKQQITVQAKNGNNRGLKNANAQFMRWVRDHMTVEENDLFDKAREESDPLVKDVLAESLVRKQATRVMHERDERIHTEIREAIRRGSIVVEPLVRPWLARKHSGKEGGTRYESQTTMERVWPAGEVDYVCAFEGCDWDSSSPRSVAMHYGQQHTRKGESEPAGDGPHHLDPEYTEPVSSREYRPTERLVEALIAALDDAIENGEDRADVARRILTWFHDRPDIDHESRPLVPLTDKDVLNRIRVLVGTPDPDQTERIDVLTAELIQARAERDEANAHLAKVQRDLNDIRELMGEVGR